ncbi:DNA alkylation repair protein [Hydrogenovibrio sp. 3SP14C1]|uniref:DNA alkylation repair protein n=1 Tax=Hydrogenovibrio sp. 3SP14C1 TaxID=3038774 RepID=UPI0024171E88|nr:DNA alkylation repair protein [Hydrogenovibrio sp. 3SP14C1]MDG4812271.1 DNA alkylation repair protein [Hydrogenovibrio sp. 3SP14C1]
MNPLKDFYNANLIQALAETISLYEPNFNCDAFQKAVLNNEWQTLELKQRIQTISLTLNRFLPKDFAQAAQILTQTAQHFKGFEYIFFPDYIEQFGQDYYDISVQALEAMTSYSSAEFAVRPLIERYPQKMMAQLLQWAQSENEHVRRLASEGCRPRLPWAKTLKSFQQDPSPIFPILKALKQDDSRYVRKSVANNLNDISKDHPDLILQTAQNWLGQHPHTDWILKHGCRTLLKQGHPEVLALFGYAKPDHIKLLTFTVPEKVRIGSNLNLIIEIQAQQAILGKVRIEIALHYRRANGQLSRKLFKIAEGDYGQQKNIEKAFPFKPLSTRHYYPGEHWLTLMINGQPMAEKSFELVGTP